MPVLEMISSKYQIYSGRDRTKGIEKGISYLKEQITLYEKKSVESMQKVQQFSIEHDLSIPVENNNNSLNLESSLSRLRQSFSQTNQNINTLDTESVRINAANQIRSIDQKIKQLDTIKDSDALVQLAINNSFINSSAMKNDDLSVLSSIQKLDSLISITKNLYTSSDPHHKSLLRQKVFLVEQLKSNLYSSLKAQRLTAEALKKSSERPEEILIKFKQLTNEASRDQSILNKLQEDLQVTYLEKARIQDPWELITVPTVLKKPVAPIKRNIVGIGLLLGMLLGSITAFILESKKKLLFTLDDIQKEFGFRMLADLSSKNNQDFNELLTLLASNLLSKVDNKRIVIIPVGNIPQETIQSFSNKMSTLLKGNDVCISKSVLDVKDFDHTIIVTSLGTSSQDDIRNLKAKLELKTKNIVGWLLLDKELN